MVIKGNVILADSGKALHKVGTETPTTITRVALAPGAKAEDWGDCDYGLPPSQDESTEEDKDAALRRFGVEV